METNGIQMETPGTEKPEPQKEPRKRVAHCKNCTYEWMASNGNEKRPSRCPTCKSRAVVWRDECSEEELARNNRPQQTAPKEQHPEKPEKPPEEPPEEPEQEPENREFSMDDAKNAISPIPMQSIVLILGIGAIIAAVFFLRRKNRQTRREPEKQTFQETETPVRYAQLPGIGGGLL